MPEEIHEGKLFKLVSDLSEVYAALSKILANITTLPPEHQQVGQAVSAHFIGKVAQLLNSSGRDSSGSPNSSPLNMSVR